MSTYKQLKNLAITITLCLAPIISASAALSKAQQTWKVNTGFYLGAEFGLSSVKYNKNQFSTAEAADIQSIKTSGFAEHINAGFIFNRYFNGELMVNYVEKPKVTFARDGQKSKDVIFKNNIVALLARLNLPLYTPRLLLMSKAGIGYVARQGLINPYNNQRLLSDQEYFRPVYSLGLDWRISKHWDMSASWLQAAPLSSAKLPATNFIGAGFYYRWK